MLDKKQLKNLLWFILPSYGAHNSYQQFGEIWTGFLAGLLIAILLWGIGKFISKFLHSSDQVTKSEIHNIEISVPPKSNFNQASFDNKFLLFCAAAIVVALLLTPLLTYEYKVSKCMGAMRDLGWIRSKEDSGGFLIQCYKIVNGK